jgi:DNA-binding NarL/FixJ family response regulator
MVSGATAGQADSASALSQLTAQERAVADLVAGGLTNKEVAAQMFISVKTVQYHLTRIYSRLGIRSRSELAAAYGPRAGE